MAASRDPHPWLRADPCLSATCSRPTKVHNISPVTAEWDFKRLFGDARDEARFRLTPTGGSLHRDQRLNIQVFARLKSYRLMLHSDGWFEREHYTRSKNAGHRMMYRVEIVYTRSGKQ